MSKQLLFFANRYNMIDVTKGKLCIKQTMEIYGHFSKVLNIVCPKMAHFERVYNSENGVMDCSHIPAPDLRISEKNSKFVHLRSTPGYTYPHL